MRSRRGEFNRNGSNNRPGTSGHQGARSRASGRRAVRHNASIRRGTLDYNASYEPDDVAETRRENIDYSVFSRAHASEVEYNPTTEDGEQGGGVMDDGTNWRRDPAFNRAPSPGFRYSPDPSPERTARVVRFNEPASRKRTKTVKFVRVGKRRFRGRTMQEITWRTRKTCNSMVDFLRSLRGVLLREIEKLRYERPRHETMKMYLCVHLTYMNVSDATKEKAVYFGTHSHRILRGSSVEDAVDAMLEEVDTRNINWIRQGSGSVIKSVDTAALNVGIYNALRGAEYVDLPKALKHKKAIVNVRNTDNRCFGYAILACKYSDQAYAKWRNDPRQYDRYFAEEGLDALNYPVAIEDLRGIEERLHLSINVLSFCDDNGAGIYPVYHSSRDPDNAINLLYWRHHYAWIKDLSRLLSSMRNHQHRMYFCMRCLGHFTTQEVLDKHKELCQGEMCRQVCAMPDEGSVVKFRNQRYIQKAPFVVYADFECLVVDAKRDRHLTPQDVAEEAARRLAERIRAEEEAQRVEAEERYLRQALGDDVYEMLPPAQQPARQQAHSSQDPSSLSAQLDSELLAMDDYVSDDDNGDRRRDLDAPPKQAYQRHVLCSGGLVLISTLPQLNLPYQSFFGGDAMVQFLERLVEIETECMRVLMDPTRMIMTMRDVEDHEAATECYVCGKEFRTDNGKVRDHDHVTGRYRGAAHSKCNLLLRTQYKIPVFIHNFRGYDSHFIVSALGAFKDRALSIIGLGMEKYITLCFGKHLQFKDSLQFLPESLESLVNSLHRAGAHKFENLNNAFPRMSDNDFEQLLRKGVYPYDYMNSWHRFYEPRLPPIEEFASRLRGGEQCKREDYAHAERMWQLLRCSTMKDYHDAYLKMDVTQLADVFENFRMVCMRNYKLDPAHYVSAPQLSWDAMLKVTGCELQLISDSEMYRTLKESLRGGVAMISKRYARANCPESGGGGNDYNPEQPEKRIMYWDANNLYGWAMSEPLPIGGFKWLERAEIDAIDWLSLKRDDPIGYFVECDLEYPEELHDEHNDYPLAPERMTIDLKSLGRRQQEIHGAYDFNRSASYAKLIPNLNGKERYTMHYRLLKYYIEHGLRLVRVHRVIAFEQRAFMEPYIRMNQDLRAASNDDFEKRFYKNMNNSCYGKTCENMSKRSDIRLLNDAKKARDLLAKPHVTSFRIFNEDLAAINMMKIRCKIDKPFYIGFTVLELSKLHMYKFHYDFVKRTWPGEQSRLLFTDTDSLMYEITAPRVYETVWANRDLFDLSDYPRNSPYYDPTNAKVIGKFKDEAGGKCITEFVGLRPKMYSYRVSDGTTVADKIRAKGIQRTAQRLMNHQDFLEQLHNPRENRVVNRRIASRLHRTYTIEFEKRGLCAFDDKRYILENGIDTLALGHCRIERERAGDGEILRPLRDDTERVVSFVEAMRDPTLRPDADHERVRGLDPDQAIAELRRQRLDEMFGSGEEEEDLVGNADAGGDMLDLLSFVF